MLYDPKWQKPAETPIRSRRNTSPRGLRLRTQPNLIGTNAMGTASLGNT